MIGRKEAEITKLGDILDMTFIIAIRKFRRALLRTINRITYAKTNRRDFRSDRSPSRLVVDGSQDTRLLVRLC